ncbi:MAG: hypothetical protein JSS91_05665 [Bacteroidetes bacterium]|nr:hypothetical protein [Bacteroidota bacterium]
MNTFKIKSVFSVLILMICFASVSYSQNNPGNSSDKKKKSPEEIAQKKADRLKNELSLNEDQYNKIYNLMVSKMKEGRELWEKNKGLDKTEKRKIMKEHREQFSKQIESILNKDQIEKFNNLKAERKQKWGKKNKNKDQNQKQNK